MTSPEDRRAENRNARTAMEDYAEIKKHKSFIKRRAKLIKTGWRNGICGVEMPDNDSSSVLYESNQSAILAYQAR